MKFSIRSAQARLVMLALALLPAGGAFAAPVLSFSGPTSAAVGSHISVNVVGSGFTDLYGYEFDVTFNPALFRATGVTEGSFLKTAGTTFFDGGTIDNTTGRASFVFDTLLGSGPGASGSGVLATLTFDTLGAFGRLGTFALDNVVALDSSISSIAFTATPLAITAVPEPATVGMLFGGLAVMSLVGNRRRKRGAPTGAPLAA